MLTAAKTGASFSRGSSRQDYATPADFLAAVVARFGPLYFDLAASDDNAKAKHYFTIRDNSLVQEWHKLPGLLWLNPPFDHIMPWACKCAEEAALGARILFLVPASVGSNWFNEFVHRKALVLALNGRLCFDPAHPTWGYPKDCILAGYGFGVGFDTWTWK